MAKIILPDDFYDEAVDETPGYGDYKQQVQRNITENPDDKNQFSEHEEPSEVPPIMFINGILNYKVTITKYRTDYMSNVEVVGQREEWVPVPSMITLKENT